MDSEIYHPAKFHGSVSTHARDRYPLPKFCGQTERQNDKKQTVADISATCLSACGITNTSTTIPPHRANITIQKVRCSVASNCTQRESMQSHAAAVFKEQATILFVHREVCTTICKHTVILVVCLEPILRRFGHLCVVDS